MQETITLEKQEFDDMRDLMERMQETIDLLSNQETVKKIESALQRINQGEYLTERQVFS